GISGAPQHLNYIGDRGVIFAFNRDPEAPIVVLNRSKPKPRVFPVLGDLFVEVPRFVRALSALHSKRSESLPASGPPPPQPVRFRPGWAPGPGCSRHPSRSLTVSKKPRPGAGAPGRRWERGRVRRTARFAAAAAPAAPRHPCVTDRSR